MVDSPQSLIKKIETLPPEQLGEVEAFVDTITARERRRRALMQTAARSSAPAFATACNNPDDDVYDAG